jgi:exonuclease III
MAEKQKRDLIFDFIRTFQADIILLQETHNDSEHIEKGWAREWGGPSIWNRGTNRSRGVGILLKNGSNFTLNNVRKDSESRIISTTLINQENGSIVNVMNLYAPTIPQDRKQFFDDLWQYKPGDQNLLLAGDFNCTVNPAIDKQGGNPLSGTTGLEELTHFINSNDLKDTWRETHPQDRIYTWNNKDFTVLSHLDRWHIPQGIQAHSSIRACPHSDHSVVEIVITVNNQKRRGKGTWKLNNTIVKD